MPRTLAFLHAHPDDEALLTAGTMARAAAEGQHVVLITATAGEAGLASTPMRAGGLGIRRTAELRHAARILGVDRTVLLDYPDSGLHGTAVPPDGRRVFADVPLAEAAGRVADVLREVGADTVVGYDPSGGYGHPDHVQVHLVGRAAAELVDAERYFEATMPRAPFAATAKAALALTRVGMDLPPDFDPEAYMSAFLPPWEITHRVNVRAHLDTKRAAMRAHASQSTGGYARTMEVMLALPRPLFAVLFGTEYYRRVWEPRGPDGGVRAEPGRRLRGAPLGCLHGSFRHRPHRWRPRCPPPGRLLPRVARHLAG